MMRIRTGKHVLALLAVLALLPGAAHAGWELTNNGIGQDSGILDIATPDQDTCYAVGVHDTGSGQEAAVWVSTSGGAMWNMQKPSTNPIAFYTSVFAPTTQKAYVGGMRYVFITTNGGTSWTQSGDAGMMTIINGVGGHGENLVMAVAGDGAIYRSDTGGVSWTAVDNPIGDPLARVYFLNETYGWLLGATWDDDAGTYHDGALLRTTDGGLNWDVLFSGENRGVLAVSFINPSEGWMVTDRGSTATFEKTTDGGVTWTEQTMPTFSEGSVNSAPDVHFFDRCEGWLILATGDDQVTSGLFYTSNAGESWVEWGMDWASVPTPFPFPVRGHPMAIDFSDRSHGYTGGFYEIIGKYTGELPAPDCGGADPDSWTDPEAPDGMDYLGDSGCGCSIVW